MKNFGIFLALLLGVALLSGCANALVPKGEISGSVGGVPFKIKSPKDVKIGKVIASVSTNGVASLEIDDLQANMNPAVVQMSGDAFVNGVNAVGTQVISGVKAGVEAAATGGAGALLLKGK
jgi:hypothetical protein